MLIFIILLPLINTLILGLFGRFIGRFGAILFATFNMFIAALFSYFTLVHILIKQTYYYYNFGSWISFFSFKNHSYVAISELNNWIILNWEFIVDSLTAIMLIIVTTITVLICIFSIFYMENDPYIVRFFMYLSLFAFFMLLLISANNILIIFIGWEGVGIMSFLLINFWFTRIQANKAAIKAIIVNRVGDIFFLTAIALIFSITRSFDFEIFFPVFDFIMNSDSSASITYEWVGFCLLIAAVGKSAQLGLHTWLPDAMEGPTPVSALIHAATMVTAGIVVILRYSNLFISIQSTSTLAIIFGIFTAFFAASAALIQYDIKKIIAYSTCSQLGYMLFIAGLQQYNISLFHLFNHAFFKALLFLSAGSIIHALINEQDTRRFGGLGDLLIFVFMISSIGTMSLAGSLFLSGFYSKDVILETSVYTYTINGLTLFWLGTLVALFTGIYSSDILDDTFSEETNSSKSVIIKMHSSSFLEIFILLILAFLSLFSGYFFRDIFLGLGTDFFTNVLAITPGNNYTPSEFLPASLKLLPTILSILISFEINTYEEQIYLSFATLHFLSYKWYIDLLQNKLIIFNIFKWSYTTFWLIDKYILELLQKKFK